MCVRESKETKRRQEVLLKIRGISENFVQVVF